MEKTAESWVERPFSNNDEHECWSRCEQCKKSVWRKPGNAYLDYEQMDCPIERAVCEAAGIEDGMPKDLAIRGGWQEDTHCWKPCTEFEALRREA